MEIDLKVPLLKQSDDNYCSLVCLQMMMHYYGDEITLEGMSELTSLIDQEKVPHLQNAAIFAVKRGYDTYLHHHEISELDKDTIYLDESKLSALENKLEELPADASDFRKKKLSLDVEYIKAGGHYSTDIDNLDFIDNCLSNKVPVTIIISNRVWKADPIVSGNHYVVVTGLKDGKYLINDPSPRKEGIYSMSRERLLLAWYKAGPYALYLTRK